jgi:aryl-alcohol dehydrogenase-like predicted oxidoreductase
MKYNQLIQESPTVSEIGLGAWQLGNESGWKEMTESEAIALVQTAYEMGVNFFDTAPNYGRQNKAGGEYKVWPYCFRRN